MIELAAQIENEHDRKLFEDLDVIYDDLGRAARNQSAVSSLFDPNDGQDNAALFLARFMIEHARHRHKLAIEAQMKEPRDPQPSGSAPDDDPRRAFVGRKRRR